MNSYRNTSKISCNMISIMLIGIAAIALSASPISVTINAGGTVSFGKSALAQDISIHTHASSNSVVGLLAIYKQNFDEAGDLNEDKAEKLRKKVAGMELDLSNPHLGNDERGSLRARLARAESKLSAMEMLKADSTGPITSTMMSKINSLMGIDLNDEIDISEASGDPDQ